MGRSGGAQPAISEDHVIEENNFSEDEEALYVAANDSEIDSDPQGKRPGQDLNLSNVTVFRRAPPQSPGADEHAFHPQPAAIWPSQAYIPQDDRTLILFDLNGVLVHHTFNGRTHKHFLRPGAEELLRLVPHYRLGIYSSATQRTVQRAMAKLHEDLVAALPTGEKPPPGGFFEVVLCRDHCVLAKEVGAFRKGGKPWDTVKPLGRYFEHLNQVVLVDDSPHKSLHEEAGNMLVMPVWAGPDTESGKNDGALPALVNGLMDALTAADNQFATGGDSSVVANRIQDIRPIVGEITETLMLLYPPPPSEDDDDEDPTSGEDAGLGAMVDTLSLNPSFGGGVKNKRSTPPPPGPPPGLGLPSPPHGVSRSSGIATRKAASIGADAIHHHAALFFLVLVKLKETPVIPGASLFEINTLLQCRFMAAYSSLFQNSAKTAVKSLLDSGTLIPLETTPLSNTTNNSSTEGSSSGFSKERGMRYCLKKEGIKLPSIERLLEIEKNAQNKKLSSSSPPPLSDGNHGDPSTTALSSNDIDDLLISTVAELETRPGVSKDALDASIVNVLQSVPGLQGWFSPTVGRDTTRLVLDTLRRLIQDALDAWCSSGDAEMVGLSSGGTPPSLFHVQITPQKGLFTVQNVFEMDKLVDDAAKDVAVALQQRGIRPGVGRKQEKPKRGERKEVEGDWRVGKAGVLPVFEDRGTLTACAVPIEAQGTGRDSTAVVVKQNTIEKKEKKKKKKEKNKVALTLTKQSDDGVIDLTADADEINLTGDDDDVLEITKKRKISQNAATTTASLATQKTKTGEGGDGVVLTRGQQKLAAMREKLGLPVNCGLTRAELKELVKEANREKQRVRDEEIQAAKVAKQRGAALLKEIPAHDDIPINNNNTTNNNNTRVNEGNISFTPLHLEIAELARQATPTPSEIATVQAAVHAVDSAARGIWPAARAVLFGSQATGLALPGGDLDIVVLGVGPQLQRAATGFTAGQRRVLGEHLEDLLDALRRSGTLLTSVQIIDAKIPIIKCLIQTSRAGPALPADISFGAINGAAAVTFLRRQILAVPPLRPLSLAVKAFLRDKGLNEVFTGGIGSYAVVNMVLAHLQREGFQADLTQADKLGLSRSSVMAQNSNVVIVDGRIIVQKVEDRNVQQQNQKQETPGPEKKIFDDDETFKYLGQLAAASNTNNPSNDLHSSSSNGNSDYGMLLWGFLERFSHEFDFLRQAISIRQGGFVKKGRWKQARRPWLLAVEDPQEPGKDICSGSFNINYVRDEFAAAAQMLAEVSEDAEANLLAAAGDGSRNHAILNASGSVTDKLPMLSLLMDVECAVGRSPAANAARRALEHQAEAARQIVKSRFQNFNSSGPQKRSLSAMDGGNSGNSGGGFRENKRQRGSDNNMNYNNFDDGGFDFPPPPSNYHKSPGQQHYSTYPQQQQHSGHYGALYPNQQQQWPQQQQQQGQQGQRQLKGSGARGGRPRGSKGGRAVEAQWKDQRGQFLDYGDDGPDYRGGERGEAPQASNRKDRRKGIKRKPRASSGGKNGDMMGPRKVKTKKKKPKKKAAAASGGGAGASPGGKKQNKKKGGRSAEKKK